MNEILQKRIEEAAKEYSFNIPSKIYQSCKTQEGMKQWKDEIESAYINGYEQADKDLELTIEDIAKVIALAYEVHCKHPFGICLSNEESIEVIKRFKEWKEARNETV